MKLNPRKVVEFTGMVIIPVALPCCESRRDEESGATGESSRSHYPLWTNWGAGSMPEDAGALTLKEASDYLPAPIPAGSEIFRAQYSEYGEKVTIAFRTTVANAGSYLQNVSELWECAPYEYERIWPPEFEASSTAESVQVGWSNSSTSKTMVVTEEAGLVWFEKEKLD